MGLRQQKERINPLNDIAFQAAFGEKGDEEQLIAFLNSSLEATGRPAIQSVNIQEAKDLPPLTLGGKLGRLDVLAVLADGSKVDIEVQRENEHNFIERSLCYWAMNYFRSIHSGDDYAQLVTVICVNILDFGLIELPDYHTSFHIYEDTHKAFKLTDKLELHFLDMVKFRKLKEKNLAVPLQRWLTYFDEHSPENLIKEVIDMDPAIEKVQEKMDWLSADDATYRKYLSLEKARLDYNSGMNWARKEGEQIGEQIGEQNGIKTVAKKLKKLGEPVDKIIQATGLSMGEINNL
jgi:predicted transposase/invertase (TIGR01784 family)